MKFVSIVLTLMTGALAAPSNEAVIQLNYHEETGIPLAARIKAAEEAIDLNVAGLVGGDAAPVGQFPYMVGLVITLQNETNSICGASLLSNRRLITAAHCQFDGSQSARMMTAVLGSARLFSGGTRIDTNRVTVHPDYNPETLNNDVAIISIPEVRFTNNIRPVSLATGSDTVFDQIATMTTVLEDGLPTVLNQLFSFVNFSVITNAQCQDVYGNRTVTDATLCAESLGANDFNSAISGSPLVINNKLIGVMSYSPAKGNTNFPILFTRVTTFVPWIQQQM